MKIGEKITKLRKLNNMTQEQLAHFLDVSRQSISKWELNEVYPETDKLIKLSKLFDCSLDYLLKEEIDKLEVNDDILNSSIKKVDVYTYLSFTPIIGIYFGYKSLSLSKNKTIPFIGIVVSTSLTILMIIGFIFNL